VEIAPIVDHLHEITIEVKYENGVQCVYLNGENLGDRIRSSDMSMYASAVSAVPAVRAFLLDTQKDIAAKNSVIMDGRDIGTVILPDADVKIFLTASPEARARRRTQELADKGMPDTYENVLADMLRRDEQDRSRDVAPAIAAPDAVHFDNSYDGFDEAVEAMLALIREGLSKKGKEI
jgi:cytidylate kinase